MLRAAARPGFPAARFFQWVRPRSRDAHERGAHDGRISAVGNVAVADISPDLCFSAVKNHGLSSLSSPPESQIVKSHFRCCRPILLLDEDPTLELKTLVWGDCTAYSSYHQILEEVSFTGEGACLLACPNNQPARR